MKFLPNPSRLHLGSCQIRTRIYRQVLYFSHDWVLRIMISNEQMQRKQAAHFCIEHQNILISYLCVEVLLSLYLAFLLYFF